MRFLEPQVKWFSDHFFSGYYPDLYLTDLVGMILICILFILILVVLFALFMSMIDGWTGHWVEKYGELIDKRYVGESHHSGTTVMPMTNGGVGVGMSSSTSPEQFLFFIQSDKVYKVCVSMKSFYDYNIQDRLSFMVKVGGISKDDLKYKLSSSS